MLISMTPNVLSTDKAKFIFEVYLIDRGYKDILNEYENLSINDIASRIGKDISSLSVIDLIKYISNQSKDKEFLYNSLLDYLIIYMSENSMSNTIYNYSKSQKVEGMIKDALAYKKYYPSDAGLAAIHLHFTETVFTTYKHKFLDKGFALDYLRNAFTNFYMNSNMSVIIKNSDKKSETIQGASGDEFSIYDKVKTDELDKKEPNFSISFKEDVKLIYEASRVFGYGKDKKSIDDFVYDIFSAYKYMYAEKRFKAFMKQCKKYFVIKPSLFMRFFDSNFIDNEDPNNFYRRNYNLRAKFMSTVLSFPADLHFEKRFDILYQNGQNRELIKDNTTDIFGDGTLTEKKERIWTIFKGMKCAEHFIGNLIHNNIDPLCVNSAMFRKEEWFKYNSNLEMYINKFDLLERAVEEECRSGNGDIIFDEESLRELYKNKSKALASCANEPLLISSPRVDKDLLSYVLSLSSTRIFLNRKEISKEFIDNFYLIMNILDKINNVFYKNENLHYLMFKDYKYNNYISAGGLEFSKFVFEEFEFKIVKEKETGRNIFKFTPKTEPMKPLIKVLKTALDIVSEYWLNRIAYPYRYQLLKSTFLFDSIRAMSLCAFIECNIGFMYEKLNSASTKMEIIDIFNRFKGFLNLFEKTPSLKDIKMCDYYDDINLTKEEATMRFGTTIKYKFRVEDKYENGIVETCINLAENGVSENENAVMDSIIRPIFLYYKKDLDILYDIKKLIDKEMYMFSTKFSTKNVNKDRLKEIADALICYPYSSTINSVKVKYLDIQDELGYYRYKDGELVTLKQNNYVYYLHKKGYWVCPELGLDGLMPF